MTKSYQYSLYLALQQQDKDNIIVEQCCEHLPPAMSMEDKLLFVGMINAIIHAPLEHLQIESWINN